jgi:hypothetical protein
MPHNCLAKQPTQAITATRLLLGSPRSIGHTYIQNPEPAPPPQPATIQILLIVPRFQPADTADNKGVGQEVATARSAHEHQTARRFRISGAGIMPTTLLCVAEKNDAAAKLAQVMSNNTARKRAGLCRYARTHICPSTARILSLPCHHLCIRN